MLLIYDKEDCKLTKPTNPIGEPPPFLERTVVWMAYVRTDSFEKTKMQNWVRGKDGVLPTTTDDNWIYNHHVPHSRIYRAVENVILGKNMTREVVIHWLIDVISELNITPDKALAATDWGASRLAYEVWADWAVSAICDWKWNIFYGPHTGDHGGITLDWPKANSENSEMQFTRVEKAAKQLDKVLDAKGFLLEKTIDHEKPVNKEDHADVENFWGKAREKETAKKLYRQFLNQDISLDEDSGDESYSDSEEVEMLDGVKKLKPTEIASGSGVSPYHSLKAKQLPKKKIPKDKKDHKSKH